MEAAFLLGLVVLRTRSAMADHPSLDPVQLGAYFALIEVTITEAGRARLAKVFPGHIEVLDQLLFEPLSRADVQALAGLLAPVRDHMRATPPRSAAPRRRRR
jgi:hypothetical protein